MDLELTLVVLAELTRRGVQYKIVGATALNFLGLARATKALDLFVLPTEDNVARLREALHAVFDDPHFDEISAADLAGDYSAIRYVPPVSGFHIDLIARLGEAFSYEDVETEHRAFEGLSLPVATARMLYRMKKDTVRLQDRADADRLRRHFDLDE